jgi:hypothetical protein
MKLQYGPVQLPPGYPSPDAPWPEAEAKGLWPKTPPPAFQQPTPAPTAQAPGQAPPGIAPAPEAFTTTPTLRPPKATKHEIALSGDFLLGQGQVTLPVGYSLKQSLGGLVQVQPTAVSASRSSDYYGGTISYSYGQTWYIDLSYVQGNSSGDQNINYGSLGEIRSHFSIDDQWYQAYVRYTFPGLRGKRLSAYLRVGATYVTAKLDDASLEPNVGRYSQHDKTDDIMGNLGFGLGYALYTSRHLRLGLQFEGEGFYGTRSQKSTEALSPDFGLEFQTADINNTLYGGIGRGTVRFEYRLGRSGLFKVFADGGYLGRYTKISYPDASAPNELLYGPYVKLGVRYAF